MSLAGAFSKADNTAGDELIVEPELERVCSKLVRIALVEEDTELTISTSDALIGRDREVQQ
jgi:hypothetical protein